MPIYLIGYDLKSGQDYSDLIAELKSFGTWWHGLDSTWLIKSEKSADNIRDLLKTKLPSSKDKLLVLKYVTSEEIGSGAAAWRGFTGSSTEWLKAPLIITAPR